MIQKFITGKNKPPYNYPVYDYVEQSRKPGYYFVMTDYGWELVYHTDNSWRHLPYFNYKPFLKITQRICDAEGEKHKAQQLALYDNTKFGKALMICSPRLTKNINSIKRLTQHI